MLVKQKTIKYSYRDGVYNLNKSYRLKVLEIVLKLSISFLIYVLGYLWTKLGYNPANGKICKRKCASQKYNAREKLVFVFRTHCQPHLHLHTWASAHFVALKISVLLLSLITTAKIDARTKSFFLYSARNNLKTWL